ncbi:Sodium:sulfate symporter transmembrane component [Erythrobacter sp. NAP1]|uniref:SLC13 family permease n=1 Tax=Erythrobacter sp. NAP1 TaxID=237727 RepID=UPI0000685208|nr:DASS family sodium-coupled anion symporter [Erythrobacter sp. NAP1]EAQ27847.1 Sodium:sulfate symporter transmembrane component [Erythrobacter sp. NAP1]
MSLPDATNRARPASLLWTYRALGIALAALVYALLGSAEMSGDARFVAAIATLMAVWWISEAAPLAVTSLLPIVLVPALTERTVRETTSAYANPIVFLFLGGFLIAIAMQKWGLHRRIALLTVKRVGVSPTRIVLGMMIATAFLSMWVSNTATTLMMVPIAISVLSLVSANAAVAGGGDAEADANIATFGVCLVLSIAWSSSMGGLATLTGSTPNAFIAGYAREQLDITIGFAEWMMLGLPLSVSFIAIGWFVMTRFLYRFDLAEIPGGKELIDREVEELGSMNAGERRVAWVFASAAFLWIVPALLEQLPLSEGMLAVLGVLDDAVIAIGAGVALFLLPASRPGEMVLNWKDAEEGLPWGVLLLFGGGLSLAGAVAGTGLDSWFGTQVAGLTTLPAILLIASVTAIVLFLTELTSNTATSATLIPVLGGVALGVGMEPMGLLVPAALAATCAFMLPVGTPPNAIVFGTGAVTIGEMARGGVVLNLIGIALITGFVYWLGGTAMGLVFS